MRVSSSEFSDLCSSGMVYNPYIFRTTPSRKNKSAMWICGAVSKMSDIALSIDNGGSEIKHDSPREAIAFLVGFGFKNNEISFGIPKL